PEHQPIIRICALLHPKAETPKVTEEARYVAIMDSLKGAMNSSDTTVKSYVTALCSALLPHSTAGGMDQLINLIEHKVRKEAQLRTHRTAPSLPFEDASYTFKPEDFNDTATRLHNQIQLVGFEHGVLAPTSRVDERLSPTFARSRCELFR